VTADLIAGDLRYAARILARKRGGAAVTILTLALGIGVVTTLFALVDAVLLRPVAADQDRVVRIWSRDVTRNLPRASLAYPEFRALRDNSRAFARLAAINYADASTSTIAIGDRPAVVSLTPVSPEFFDVILHAAPLYGRWLEQNDDRSTAPLTAVISERFWRRALGGDPRIVGRSLTWAGSDRTVRIVGVAPRALDYPLGTDLWVPIASFFAGPGSMHFDIEDRRLAQFELIGRLAPGVTLDSARAELVVLEHRLASQFSADYTPQPIVVTPILDTVVGDSRQMLIVLFVAAALVFVIAGVNVAALLLMRASERTQEYSVRAALGASLRRLASQAVVESSVLAVTAGVIGLLFARAMLAGAVWLAPADVPRLDRAVLDGRAAGFGLAISAIWVLVLGTAPIWKLRWLQASRGRRAFDVTDRMTRRTIGLRALTIAEIGAAVFVAITAALLIRSFVHLTALDRGFDSKDLTVVNVLLPESRYADATQRLAFYEHLLARVSAIPGVASASPVHMVPGTGNVGLSAPMIFEGQTPEEASRNPWATWEPVTPSFFETLGVPLASGRRFTGADRAGAAPVAIVSEAVGRRYWPGQDPIGRRLRVAQEFPWVTVVGVVRDVRYRELTRDWMTVYFPAGQFFFFAPGSLVVRSTLPAHAIVPALREAIRAEEPFAAIESIASMDSLLAREISRPRATMMAAGLFALLAVLLGAVGVYAILGAEVRQRRRELAIRSAIGATPARLLRDILSRSLTVCGAGIGIGLAVAAAATPFIRGLLFNVDPGDPAAFVAGAMLLATVVTLASLVPARRAASTDPAVVLRSE
jgi:predicted permease